VVAVDDGWCFSASYKTNGSEPTFWRWTLCLREGHGLIGGAAHFLAMAETDDVRFGSVPK
jgi:hypothetical protein